MPFDCLVSKPQFLGTDILRSVQEVYEYPSVTPILGIKYPNKTPKLVYIRTFPQLLRQLCRGIVVTGVTTSQRGTKAKSMAFEGLVVRGREKVLTYLRR